jgi:DNA-directed RNA polymerase subunit F
MPSPQFVEQKTLSLGETKDILVAIEKRDEQLGFLSNKAKEYAETFVTLSTKQREELIKKLNGLSVTRLKEEVVGKIVDFLPKNANELKVILSAYSMTLTKKDMDSIVEAVVEVCK